MVQFQPLNLAERNRLRGVLERNAAGRCAVLMDPRDTTFVGEEDVAALEEDNRVVDAIKSVPCHY
jgi:hypothetical protein